MSRNINYPPFFNPSQVGRVYRPNVATAIAEGRKAGWMASSRDKRKICLFLVDMQNDFCLLDGALPVPGALDDARRVIDLIYSQGDKVTTIAPTMDTHKPMQIFFSPWWANARGENPEPFTIITEEDIRQGVWRAVIMSRWSHWYISELKRTGKNDLMIWPYHCMDGSEGADLLSPVYEAIMYHSAARYTQPHVLHKGMIAQTEHYSPLRPEVDVDGVIGGGVNTDFLNVLQSHDVILVAGEAKSHCVLAAMETLVEYFGANEPDVLSRIYFLTDCTSSVVHPAVDFEAIANKRLAEMQRNHGIQLVKSTEITL